jgi:tetratricopeptide (TPR) repeat protein
MPTLRLDTYSMPSANLGRPSPLPALRPYTSASSGGFSGTYLPYRTQDGYDRNKTPQEHRVAVLENDRLKAVFLLNLGGRLWSLYHKPSKRELLETNPVFQPANLAIRNAWFSGGVEWNVSLLGHCPFTCSPLFAAAIEGPDGPALRLYEFERIRQAVFEIDFHLPEGSDFLFVRPRLTNTQDREVDMYWWSNIAVRETEGTRVLAPTDHAWGHRYDDAGEMGQIDMREIPDRTYSTRSKNAGDVFFAIPEEQRPWEAALEADGSGLLHVSTERLYGRKLFHWGTGGGGRKWQEYLSEPGRAYIEIQAGLARTQGEYAKMPARAVWTWLEAYGPFSVAPDVVHQPGWTQAWKDIDREVEALVPPEPMKERLALLDGREWPIKCLLNYGSGWGALEELRRDSTLASGAVFPSESIGDGERPWLNLLSCGVLPTATTEAAPEELMVQEDWIPILKESIEFGDGDHWLSWYHLGVALWAADRREEAEEAWRRSIEREPSPWAYRNLAVASELKGHVDEGARLVALAATLRPSESSLIHQACAALLGAGKYQDLQILVSKLPSGTRDLPRVRLALASAALALGDLHVVEEFFERPLDIVDIREGELSLSEMWFDLQAAKLAAAEGKPADEAAIRRLRLQCPPPPGFDFRMSD